MMKKYFLFVFLTFFLICSCGQKKDGIKEGVLTYKIDYPEIRDNFFLYHVLPKELITSFKEDRMEMKIKKANMENTLVIDSKHKKISTYYMYDDVLSAELSPSDIKSVLSKHPKYQIKLTKEKDTLLGFHIKKAKVSVPQKNNVSFDLWYTDEISIKNSNWFNGFDKVPGVLLKYSIYQYGLRMDFVATKFEDVPVSDSIVNLKRPGKKISHEVYDKKINELFESFK